MFYILNSSILVVTFWTRQTKDSFHIVWPSCPKVVMDCLFSLLNWVFLAIIYFSTLVVVDLMGLLTLYQTIDSLKHINKKRNVTI